MERSAALYAIYGVGRTLHKCGRQWTYFLTLIPIFFLSTGHVEVVKILLENDADIGCKDRHHFTPLHSASASGQVSVVKVLLDHGAKVSHNTPSLP